MEGWDVSMWEVPAFDSADLEEGGRGSTYAQSDFPKLLNGNVKIVFASLYPFEQGWLGKMEYGAESGREVEMPDLESMDWLEEAQSEGFSLPRSNNYDEIRLTLKDQLLSKIVSFDYTKLRQVKSETYDYWSKLNDEYQMYLKDNNVVHRIRKDLCDEMAYYLKQTGQERELIKEGKYVIIDACNTIQDDPDYIQVVLNLEGMHALGMDHDLKPVSREVLLNRIKQIKERTPIFSITLSHHFYNGICGHTRSIPVFLRSFRLINQEYMMYEPFNELGKEVLLYLLSIKPEGDHYVDDPNAGRRILVDIKHLSVLARMELYDIVQKYNECNPATAIPIMASHVGYSGETFADLVANRDKEQKGKFKNGYNSWGINLGKEEIATLVATGGMIGLCFEQNIMGIKSLPKGKTWIDVVGGHILEMAELSTNKHVQTDNNFWDCISFGTDFDGIINPVDDYSSALTFPKLRADLIGYFAKVFQAKGSKRYHVPAEYEGRIEALVDKVCYGNIYQFVKKHFRNDQCPNLVEDKPVLD